MNSLIQLLRTCLAAAVMVFTGAAAASDASPARGLVSYWNFDDNMADSAWLYTNESGTAEDNFKVAGGRQQFAPGKVGRAIKLAGTYLVTKTSPDVKLGPTYTIEAWIRPAELGAQWQRLLLNWGGEKSYHFGVHNRQLSLYHKQTDGQEPRAEGGTVVEGRWQHVAGVANARTGQLTVYLDGKPVATVPYDGTMNASQREGLGVADSAGGPGIGSRFSGCIDELAIWNVALTQQQIESRFKHPQLRLTLAEKTYRREIADDEPHAWWRFDEAGGSVVKDSSPGAHHGTCHGGVTFGQAGIPAVAENKAAIFDGKNGFIDLGDTDRLDAAKAITIEVWIRWTGPPGGFTREADFLRKESVFALGGSWYANRGAATYRKARFWIHTDRHGWLNSDNGSTDLDDGRWHHVAGVYDGRFLRIYVDGIEESSRDVGAVSLSANDEPVIVASSAGKGEFFTGAIDELAVYTRALSPTEIYEHYVFGSDVRF